LPSAAAKSGRCPECGAVISSRPEQAVAKKAVLASAKPALETRLSPRRSRRGAEKRELDRPGNPYLTPLQLVSGAYFPFLGGVVLTSAALGALVLIKWRGPLAISFGVTLILTSLHVVLGLFALFRGVEDKDELEIELPGKRQLGLAKLVEQVASERGLDAPDVIRLHVQSLAHVYMDRDGQTILVIGGTLIAVLPQRALAGVIAHELSHLTAGDVSRSRLAAHWHRVMVNLEVKFLTQNWAVWNPLVWLIRLYHLIYMRLFFASQRREEFLADSYYVDQAGEENAATTLVLVHVLEHMPGANLATMAEHMAMANQRVDDFFAEQVRRLRGASNSAWEDSLKRALRQETEPYSTHPCLKDRLRPLGVKARDVLPSAMNLTGEPATALFANWPEVEKRLTKKLQAYARVYFVGRQQEFEDIAALLKTF
jgi:Zn-dependent protease with chaperone function